MKVKELIKNLSKLDQEKDIWIVYDAYYPMEPWVDSFIREEDIDTYKEYDKDVNIGDYVINVW